MFYLMICFHYIYNQPRFAITVISCYVNHLSLLTCAYEHGQGYTQPQLCFDKKLQPCYSY